MEESEGWNPLLDQPEVSVARPKFVSANDRDRRQHDIRERERYAVRPQDGEVVPDRVPAIFGGRNLRE